MFGLSAPAWLFGLASLAIPLAIHLRSRRAGRTVRVGSVRLLTGTPAARARSLRIQQPWLLLLRLGLLVALVLLLAAPYWEGAAGSTPESLVLIAPEVWFDSDLISTDPVLDSIASHGIPARLLAPGFPPVALRSTSPPRSGSGPPQDYWSLLREADRLVPPGSHLLVVAPDRARFFRGTRPLLRSVVTWHSVEAADRSVTGQPVADTAQVRLTIYSEQNREDDVRYLAAAFRAIAAVGHRSLTVASRSAAGPGIHGGDEPREWIVWLSDRGPPASVMQWVRLGGNLLTDSTSGRNATDSASPAAPVGTIWSDGAGRPLLTLEPVGTGRHYRFRQRFNPGTGSLVFSPSFPELMADLLGAQPAPTDSRISIPQLLPAPDSSRHARAEPRRAGLSAPLWALLLLLFGLERLISARANRP